MKLIDKIESEQPGEGELTIFSLAQAGFAFRTSDSKTVVLDPYLSDCCERFFGFKRMIPTLVRVNELRADIFIATHSHNDHFDPDLVESMKDHTKTQFVGAPDCSSLYKAAGIEDSQVTILAAEDQAQIGNLSLKAIYADHGDLAPDAVGMWIDFGGITVYDTGDTAYRPEEITASLAGARVDILIVPINPAFGNPGHENAVKLAAQIKPKVVIGCHFGMFIDHGGDPGAFLQYAQETLPESVTAMIMAPGERLVFSASHGIMQTETFSEC